jgi:hypothetical protein
LAFEPSRLFLTRHCPSRCWAGIFQHGIYVGRQITHRRSSNMPNNPKIGWTIDLISGALNFNRAEDRLEFFWRCAHARDRKTLHRGRK